MKILIRTHEIEERTYEICNEDDCDTDCPNYNYYDNNRQYRNANESYDGEGRNDDANNSYNEECSDGE